jgi:ribosomal protein S18 acetylase RimI-like enzyme
MKTTDNIVIRVATVDDRDFIISLIPRLTEFGTPAWRNRSEMISTDTQIIIDKLNNSPSGTVIFIAEDDQSVPLGFIHLHSGSDYYNKESHAHISDVIVADKAAGKGIGLALITKGEAWAREQGFRWITLSVFAQNLRARELYRRIGYGEDIMKYVKEL